MFMYIYKVPDTVHKAKYHSYNLYNIVFIHIEIYDTTSDSE